MNRALPWLLPFVIAVSWEALAHAGVADPRFLPGVEQVATRAIGELREQDLLGHVLASLQRDLIGFTIGAALGTGAGLSIGLSRPIARLVGPTLLVHRQIALFAWIPLLSMWFGGGESGKIAFIALAAFQPSLSNTWSGVAGVPAKLHELAAVLTLGRLDGLRLITLPAAMPSILTGLQSALIYAWVATIGAELLLNVAPGIGGRMNEGQQLFHMDLLLLCVLLMGVIGLVFNLLAGLLRERLLHWRTL
jgi:sulfonate transport system permease protein